MHLVAGPRSAHRSAGSPAASLRRCSASSSASSGMPGSQGNATRHSARRAGVGHLEERRPFHRVGDVGVHGEAVRAEVVGRAHHQELLGPGEALELDRQELAHGAAAAVGADQPRSLELARNAVGLDTAPARVSPLLLEAGDAMAEVHLGVGLAGAGGRAGSASGGAARGAAGTGYGVTSASSAEVELAPTRLAAPLADLPVAHLQPVLVHALR